VFKKYTVIRHAGLPTNEGIFLLRIGQFIMLNIL